MSILTESNLDYYEDLYDLISAVQEGDIEAVTSTLSNCMLYLNIIIDQTPYIYRYIILIKQHR